MNTSAMRESHNNSAVLRESPQHNKSSKMPSLQKGMLPKVVEGSSAASAAHHASNVRKTHLKLDPIEEALPVATSSQFH